MIFTSINGIDVEGATKLGESISKLLNLTVLDFNCK
jgi:hypothetical protein